jgi:predicted Zn-dependent peptidase
VKVYVRFTPFPASQLTATKQARREKTGKGDHRVTPPEGLEGLPRAETKAVQPGCPASSIISVQEYVLSELDRGERVITERVGSVRSVSLGFWIGAGSRDEPDAKAGVTHFIEHLLFKGTRSYTAQQIAETFDGLGGELNAATSRESTVVYARVPDRHLETALDVMADMVFAPSFADVDAEREVVLEEIAMVEDTPQDLVHDLLAEAVFGSNPLGRPVIGRAGVISTVSRRSLSAYHR